MKINKNNFKNRRIMNKIELTDKEKENCLKQSLKLGLVVENTKPVMKDLITSIFEVMNEVEESQVKHELKLEALREQAKHEMTLKKLKNYAEQKKLANSYGLDVDIHGYITVLNDGSGVDTTATMNDEEFEETK